jgi:glycosyltransferase involved in cell wall biosynthesis
MHIVLINYEFPPLGGGAGNATLSIAREFARAGHKIIVLTAWFEGLKERETVDGYTVVRVRSRRARMDRSNVFEMMHFAYKAQGEATRLAKEGRIDRTIAFFALPSGLVSYYLYKKYKIPYIVSLRGGDVPGFLHEELKWHHRLAAPLTRIVWKNASHIVANSHGLVSCALPTATRYGKKVEMIPNGVDTSFFYPSSSNTPISSAQQTPAASGGRFRLLYVGRVASQKALDTLVQAFATITLSHPSMRGVLSCEIVGDGPLLPLLKEQARKLGIEKMFIFSGWLSKAEVAKTYRRADAFVFPSLDEGMPNAVLEAMASGLPIIAAKARGTDELVTDGYNGILYATSRDLPKAIIDLVYDEETRRRYALHSLERARTMSWHSVASSYESLL